MKVASGTEDRRAQRVVCRRRYPAPPARHEWRPKYDRLDFVVEKSTSAVWPRACSERKGSPVPRDPLCERFRKVSPHHAGRAKKLKASDTRLPRRPQQGRLPTVLTARNLRNGSRALSRSTPARAARWTSDSTRSRAPDRRWTRRHSTGRRRPDVDKNERSGPEGRSLSMPERDSSL